MSAFQTLASATRADTPEQTPPLAPEQMLAKAVTLHTQGRLSDAETLYTTVLRADSANFHARHLLGLVRYQQGRFADAVTIIGEALEHDPNVADAHNNLGVALVNLNRYEEAITSYRRALEIRPDYAEAHNNLGNALRNALRHEEAIASYRSALEIQPDYAEAHQNLGVALIDLGRHEEAIASFRKALEIRPDYAEAYYNLGNVLRYGHRDEEAVTCYRRAVEINPDHAEAYNNLGVVLGNLKRHEEAIVSCRRALEIKPNYAEAYNTLGGSLTHLKLDEEAITNYRRALEIEPRYADALSNLGVALGRLNRHREAVAAYRRAINIRPDLAHQHLNLGNALSHLRRYDEAIASFQRALEIDPEQREPFGALAEARRSVGDWTNYDDTKRELREDVRQARCAVGPFIGLMFLDCPQEQLQCARTYVKDRVGSLPAPIHRSSPGARDRIRLGYLSGDFRQHAVAYLTAELFEVHDRDRFEIFAFSFGPDDRSDIRRRLRNATEHFVDVRGESDSDLARRISELGIDIAIDLMGHTGHNRLQVLARRPAPVQVNYLGFPGTMGAEFIDYILVDPFVVPADQQPFFAENLVHLPDCYQVNDRKRPIPEKTPSRAECGLPEDRFVFCSFNNTYKITPPFFDVWMRLLKSVPGSVLWLVWQNDAVDRIRREAKDRDVDPDRLIFAPRVGYADYLARYALADLFLDTQPYNGGTTVSDALWAGLPVITCAGKTFASRMAGSLLRAVGLPELVTRDLEEYEALALELATNAPVLDGIRAKLAQNRLTAPLFDTDRFRFNIEAAYTEMYRIWESGQPPRPIAVAPDRGGGSR